VSDASDAVFRRTVVTNSSVSTSSNGNQRMQAYCVGKYILYVSRKFIQSINYKKTWNAFGMIVGRQVEIFELVRKVRQTVHLHLQFYCSTIAFASTQDRPKSSPSDLSVIPHICAD